MNGEAATLLEHALQPLEPFRVPEVEDICVNGPGEAFIRTRGRWERHPVALDYEDLVDATVLAGAYRRQDVGERQPLLSTELPDGSRLQAVLPPCVPGGTVSWTVRQHAAQTAPISAIRSRYKTERWNRWDRRHEARKADFAKILAKYDEDDPEGFFRECVRLRFNILLAGATGSGKSSFLKTVLSVMGEYERLITVENARELRIEQPNAVHLLYSHGEQDVSGVPQRALMQAALRMRPDRSFLGELRDNEAGFFFVSEAAMSHPGSASTIHGKDAKEGFQRLFNMVKGSDDGRTMGDDVVAQMIGDAVDVIVPFREVDGVYEIQEVWLRPEAERRGKTIAELRE